MLNITIVCVGRIKEKYYCAAVDEYVKRIGRFAKINIAEVKDEAIPDSPSDGEKMAVLLREAERIKAKIPKNSYIYALCVEGRQCTSEKFAQKLSKLTVSGISHVVFIIGGSLGLADEIKSLADERLSFSEMTLPHQLMRVVLSEQIYRALTINNNITYHK